jgi:hypothetical protein
MFGKEAINIGKWNNKLSGMKQLKIGNASINNRECSKNPSRCS